MLCSRFYKNTLFIFVLTCTATVSTDLDGSNDHQKLNALKGEIARLQQSLRQVNDERGKLAEQLRLTELRASGIRKKLASLDRQITELKQALATLNKKQEMLLANKAQQAKVVASELRAAYRLGHQEPVKLLLNLDHPDNISRVLKYYEYLVTARSEILMEYQATLEDIERVQSTLQTKQQQLQQDRADHAAAAAALSRELSERETLLSTINNRFNKDQSRLANLQVERKQLESLLAKLAANVQDLSAANQIPFGQARGKLPWPVRGRIRHSYGAKRNADLKWTGWLLSAKEASPVHAVHYGRVVFSDYLRGHGLMLIIDHGAGYLSLYAHNQMLLKETGDWVSAGESIAQVGNTGGLTLHALYFEIRHRGKTVDPKRWLRPKA